MLAAHVVTELTEEATNEDHDGSNWVKDCRAMVKGKKSSFHAITVNAGPALAFFHYLNVVQGGFLHFGPILTRISNLY